MKINKRVSTFSVFVTSFVLLFMLSFSSIPTFAYTPNSSHSALVYVENAGSNSVSVINGTKVIKTIVVGSFPVGQMAYAPNKHELFVTNYGEEEGTTVSVINTLTNKVTKTISAFEAPISATYVQTSNAVYVANDGTNQVYVVNATSLRIVAKINVGSEPLFFMLSPVTGLLSVTNGNSSSISVINPATDKVVQTVTKLNEPAGIAFDPANNDTYVVNEGTASVAVFNSNYKLLKDITGFSTPFYLAYNPTNKDMYLTGGPEASVVYVISSANKVVKTISGFDEPSFIAFNPSNGLMYVCNVGSNNVQTVNGYKLEKTISVEEFPFGIIVVTNTIS